MDDRPFGIDFGEIPYTTCAICGEYVWESEVDGGQAFFEAFDFRPPHHIRCLPDFVKTRKLLPQYMSYYQKPWEWEQSEGGASGVLLTIRRQAEAEGKPYEVMTWQAVEKWLLAQAMIRGFTLPTPSLHADMEFLTSIGIQP